MRVGYHGEGRQIDVFIAFFHTAETYPEPAVVLQEKLTTETEFKTPQLPNTNLKWIFRKIWHIVFQGIKW